MRLVCIAFVAVFGSAYASILITRGVEHLAPVWPANALALVLLLRAPARAWARIDIVASAGAGSVLANWLGGTPLPLSLWFTVANGLEVLIAFWLIRRGDDSVQAGQAFERASKPFRTLLTAGAFAPAAGATIAAAGLSLLVGADYWSSWVEWFLTALLGFLIIAPLGVSVSDDDWRPLMTAKGVRSAALCALLVGGVSFAVFAQTSWPLLFLITPVILHAAYRRRALGAAAAVALTAMIAVPLTAAGHGPLVLTEYAGSQERQFLLQLFLLTQSLVALAIAAMLDERDGLRRAIEARAQAALEADKVKSRLLMGVAHDIRTPLNAIQGLGELLAKNEDLPEHERRYVEGIQGASAQLQALASDLLDRSRIERGALVLAPEMLDAAALIDAILLEARDWPEAKDVILKASTPPGVRVWADPVRARQILRNFVSNAVKYAGVNGPILVRARSFGETIRFEVADRGPGIASARQHEVFEPFARIGAGEGKGAGVGLSLVKLLAEAQGGRVGVVSTPFVETRFWVDLPAHAVGAAPPLDEGMQEIDPDLIFGRASDVSQACGGDREI